MTEQYTIGRIEFGPVSEGQDRIRAGMVKADRDHLHKRLGEVQSELAAARALLAGLMKLDNDNEVVEGDSTCCFGYTPEFRELVDRVRAFLEGVAL